MGEKMEKELKHLLFEHQQSETTHIPITEEYEFYRSIQSGLDVPINEHRDAKPKDRTGILSKNPLRNARYHLIIMTAMITRFCIEGGLQAETAYTMSDYFINLIDETDDKEKLSDIKEKIIKEFTQTMREINGDSPKSYHIVKLTDYIQNNITKPIRPADAADNVKMSVGYLSTLCKKETGYSLSDYILYEKCKTAKYMLSNSQATAAEISAFLGFASASYFTIRFKKIMRITPMEYRSNIRLHELSNME